MNIEFIKWMCEKAEGFNIIERKTYTVIDYMEDRETLESFLSCESIAKSLLLQRAIEGVNRGVVLNTKDLFINQNMSCVTIEEANPYGNTIDSFRFEEMEIDQAKEAALLYFYEQIENKK